MTDFIVVGSGAGGATLAKELSKKGKKVIIVERGHTVKETENLGTWKAGLYYERNPFWKMLLKPRGAGTPLMSKEGTIIARTIMTGGSTVFSAGCGVRSFQREFSDLGINLEEEFAEVERELNIAPLSEKRIMKGSRKIMESANELGYKMEPMPKFVDPQKCRLCGRCVFGCKFDAKWTALRYVNQAIENGASLIPDTKVTKVLISNGKVRGIEGIGPDGRVEILGDTVVVAAGGINTPIILQRSGVSNAGKKLFCDLCNFTYGITEDTGLLNEINMATVDYEFHDSKGFILSPFMDNPSIFFRYLTGRKSITGELPRKRTLNIMTKISDESVGKVEMDGRIEKPVIPKDRDKLENGSSIAKDILINAGAKRESIFTAKRLFGAHPGGTAAIGELVNRNLETEIENLYVCDASVFPKSPGLPPILTIVALSKWFSKNLTL